MARLYEERAAVAKGGPFPLASGERGRYGAALLMSPRPGSPDHLLVLPPLRAILRLATPTTLVMLIAAASNVLYTYYVSRLGAEAIAAVSLVFPISLLAATAMAGGLGAGVSSAVARALGGGRRREAGTIGEQALSLAALVGVGFGLVVLIGAPTIFRLMGGTGGVLDQAIVFARVVFGGAAITFVAGMFDSVMRGEGNVRVPAMCSSASLLLQIALTPLFMFVAGWGLVGAALAMLTSQLLAALPRARWVFGGRGVLTLSARPRRLAWAPVREILRVGIPASLSTTVSQLGMMVLTGVLARLGAAHLAAYGLGTRLDFLLLTIAYGVGAAVLTLVGLAAGAGRPDRIVAYVVRSGMIVFVTLAVPGLLLSWRPTLWLGLFTHDEGIQTVGAEYFRLIGPSYPFMGISMVIAFAFQGLGRATAPLVWMIARVVAVLAVSLVCTQLLGMGDRAVFAAVAAGNVVSAAAMLALFVLLYVRPRGEASPRPARDAAA
jgi:putative MATE family efflux protein